MSTRPMKWRHYTATLKTAELVIELENLAEFLRFSTDHRSQSIYCFTENQKIAHFGISHKGGLLLAKAEGFKQLDHYAQAVEKGFPTAKSYYKALKKGFDTYEAYRLSKESELNDPKAYKNLVEQHYKEGFEDYKSLLAEGKLLHIPNGGIHNEYDLYHYGTQNGFTNWFELQPALEKGFATAANYRSAIERGYDNAADFQEGMKGGFIGYKDWKEAKAADCHTREEYCSKQDLDIMITKNLKHDACVLLQLLSRLPENTTVAIEKLQTLLEKELKLYQNPDTKLFRSWFTLQFRDKKSILLFLRKNNLVKAFGTYHHQQGEYITHSIKKRHVVLDGSNVAHNSNVDPKSPPKVENLKRMTQYLTDKGFEDILVVVDASLKHQVEDPEALEAYAKTVNYKEAEAYTSADITIINYVKQHNCLMISNDLFRDWKAIDLWLKDNIDYYRLTFKITDKKVFLPELES